MLKLGRVTKVKVLFLVLVFGFNFDLFKFSAAILEKGLLPRNPQTLQHVYSTPGCSTSLSVTPLAVQDNIFQDIVDIQRKQTELSQIMVSQQARSLLPSSEPPVFYGDAMEFPVFMTAFESLIESKVEDCVKYCIFWDSTLQVKLKKLLMSVFRENQKDPTKKPRAC